MWLQRVVAVCRRIKEHNCSSFFFFFMVCSQLRTQLYLMVGRQLGLWMLWLNFQASSCRRPLTGTFNKTRILIILALLSGIDVGSWYLAGQDFHRAHGGLPMLQHVGMIANSKGNDPSRLLHASPNRTQNDHYRIFIKMVWYFL
jgi:hypothetical protein